MNDLISKLQLKPHPEGGYYKQICGDESTGTESISSIYYMLKDEEFSAFHCLHQMVEIWYYHAGETMNIYVIAPDGTLTTHRLGPDGEMQVLIQPEHWFAAEIPSHQGFSLVGCAVAPAFKYENFELSNSENLCQKFPQHKELISKLRVEN